MPKRYFMTMLEPEDIEALKAASAATGLSVSAIIRLAVRGWLKAPGVVVEKARRPGREARRTRKKS